jgi:hypothetical protein
LGQQKRVLCAQLSTLILRGSTKARRPTRGVARMERIFGFALAAQEVNGLKLGQMTAVARRWRVI